MRVKQKLHIYNSAFEIANQDIINLELEYEFDQNYYVKYKEGKKVAEGTQQIICFEIIGTNKELKKAAFEFSIYMGLEEMNRLKSKPVDISKKIHFDGPPLKRPNDEENSFINFDYATDSIRDMFKNLASAYICKKRKNVFIIKVSIPDENVFVYFEVDFNDKGDKITC